MRDYINEQLQGFDAKLDKQRGDQLTLEHYTERYIPVQVQGMIMDNMARIHDEKTMKKVKAEENAIYMKMQRQLMDMTNFTDGTIFDNIIQINAEMSKKMNLRVDLTTNTCVPDQDSKEDKATALERKLDNYIQKFINLNANNEVALDQARDGLLKDNKDHLALFDAKLQQNLSEIFKYTTQDEARKDQFKKELQVYVQELHTDFE